MEYGLQRGGPYSKINPALAVGTTYADNSVQGGQSYYYVTTAVDSTGIQIGSPEAGAAAGCQNNVTPFNGEHNAGIQAMSTRHFGNTHGPLRNFK